MYSDLNIVVGWSLVFCSSHIIYRVEDISVASLGEDFGGGRPGNDISMQPQG